MTPCTPAGVPAARPTRAKPTWPIDEYAISRLKFACPMAANEPSAIDMIEMKTMICCHCVVIAGNAVMMTRTRDRDGGDLRRGGEKRGDRRRRTFIDVGRPHVERHGRHFEGETDHEEDEAENDACRGSGGDRRGDAGKCHGAGKSIEQRGAVEHHSRRQRAKHEIFEPGFGSTHVVAVEGGDDIERQRHQFEPEIERDQAVRRNEHLHADRRQDDEDRKLELLQPGAAHVILRHDERDQRAEQRQDFHKARKAVVDEGTVENLGACLARQQCRENRQREETDGELGDEPAGALAADRANHDQHKRADRQQKLGEGVRQDEGKNGHRCAWIVGSAAAFVVDSAASKFLTSCSTGAAVGSSTGWGRTP